MKHDRNRYGSLLDDSFGSIQECRFRAWTRIDRVSKRDLVPSLLSARERNHGTLEERERRRAGRKRTARNYCTVSPWESTTSEFNKMHVEFWYSCLVYSRLTRWYNARARVYTIRIYKTFMHPYTYYISSFKLYVYFTHKIDLIVE